MSGRGLTVAMPISSFLPNQGGAEVGLHNIALRLDRLGHTPVVIAPLSSVRALGREGWRLPYRVVAFPPKVWTLFRRSPAAGFFVLDRFFGRVRRRFGVDVWHATVGYPTGVALVHFALRAGGAPHLVRCAGEDLQRMPKIGYGARLDYKIDRLVRHWLPRADMLIAISESVAAEYRELGIPEARVRRVPNGVDLSRFSGEVDRAAVRRRHGIDESAFVFLCVSRNHPKKDLATFVQAAGALQRRGVPRRFVAVLVGRGVSSLTPVVWEAGAEPCVRLIEEIGGKAGAGAVPQLPARALVELYKAADAFVLPALIETFGIVLIEAMAAGLPVVTTDAPGCRDVIREGRDGMMVPHGDTAALARAMERLLDEPSLRHDYAARAAARAAEFDWDSVVGRYAALYERLVGEAAR